MIEIICITLWRLSIDGRLNITKRKCAPRSSESVAPFERQTRTSSFDACAHAIIEQGVLIVAAAALIIKGRLHCLEWRSLQSHQARVVAAAGILTSHVVNLDASWLMHTSNKSTSKQFLCTYKNPVGGFCSNQKI